MTHAGERFDGSFYVAMSCLTAFADCADQRAGIAFAVVNGVEREWGLTGSFLRHTGILCQCVLIAWLDVTSLAIVAKD
jgi:hypothetical protein